MIHIRTRELITGQDLYAEDSPRLQISASTKLTTKAAIVAVEPDKSVLGFSYGRIVLEMPLPWMFFKVYVTRYNDSVVGKCWNYCFAKEYTPGDEEITVYNPYLPNILAWIEYPERLLGSRMISGGIYNISPQNFAISCHLAYYLYAMTPEQKLIYTDEKIAAETLQEFYATSFSLTIDPLHNEHPFMEQITSTSKENHYSILASMSQEEINKLDWGFSRTVKVEDL